ncbi:hypothetical protein [uncultured Clostridium sp.]|uniref:hypothetical protein n=1 Tax=uncultured Clostridium sp. TaxID=59620 RepID=UPI0025F050AE|nr:hypothetical protein [uncultured Clostridium sp.]
MGNFKFEVLEKNKILNLTFDGFFEEKDAERFKQEYAKIVNDLGNSKEYELHIDSKEMTLIKASLLNDLSKCIKQYTIDFKKVSVIERKDNKILKIQTNKIIENLGIIEKVQITDD